MAKKKNYTQDFQVKNNLLYYIPKQTPDHALKVEGKWDISKNGRLSFNVGHSQNQVFGKTVIVGTSLNRVNTASLEFKAANRITPNNKELNSVTLTGQLIALPKKKIGFVFAHEGKEKVLELSGDWDILKDNKIGCAIKRIKNSKEITSLIVLNGSWDICGNTIFYKVDNSKRNFLNQEFKISRTVFNDRENSIEFDLGVGGKKDTITLNGIWKQETTKAEFIFTSSKRQSFAFNLNRKLSDDKELVFELDAGKGKKPSFILTLAKKIKGDSCFFIRGKIAGKEKSSQAGFYFPF